jgi:hypothetical protein
VPHPKIAQVAILGWDFDFFLVLRVPAPTTCPPLHISQFFIHV